MNREHKKLMENPEKKPFMDLSKDVRGLMMLYVKNLQRLRGNGEWRPIEASHFLGEGYIFRIDPNTPVGNEAKEYTVFWGSDGIYKVNLEQPNANKPRVRYLVTVTGMRGFEGIRYQGSDELRQVLNIPLYGMPMAVRLKL